MRRRKMFVETSVALKVGTKLLPERSWEALVEQLAIDFDFVVSPLTFFEILNRLAGGKTQYVVRNARSLLALSPTGPRDSTFLEMPGQFVLREVLKCGPVSDTFQPEHLRDAMAIILEERELSPELVAWLADVRRMHGSGTGDLVEKYREIQKLGQTEPNRELWLRAKFEQLGIISLSSGEVAALGGRLDAAYQYDAWTRQNQLRNPAYVPTPERSRGDWVDGQQLWYLADPQIHMLYVDRDFKIRTEQSAQKAQLVDALRMLKDSDYLKGISALRRHEPTISLEELERQLGFD